MMASPRGPRPRGHERAGGTSERAYRSLLRAYPRELREEYGDEMARCFRDLCREELEDGRVLGPAALWTRTLPELIYTTLKERSTMLNRNAYRSVGGVALATAFILLIPLLAEWAWTLTDFVIAGALIFGTGVTFVLVAGTAGNIAYRFAVGIVGATIARFRPPGMARALFATALAQALIAVIALVFGSGLPWSPPVEILGLTGFFVSLFVGSALLFRYAAREQPSAGAGQEG